MRAPVFLILLLAMLVSRGVSLPQSLAELAEKEKARRAGLRTKSQVWTEKDLEAAKGDTQSITGEAPREDEAPDAKKDAKKKEERPPLDALRRERIRKMEAWAAEWERRMASATRNVTELREKAKNCRLAGRMYFFMYAWGCESIEERLAQAEAELGEVESSRYDWDRR